MSEQATHQAGNPAAATKGTRKESPPSAPKIPGYKCPLDTFSSGFCSDTFCLPLPAVSVWERSWETKLETKRKAGASGSPVLQVSKVMSPPFCHRMSPLAVTLDFSKPRISLVGGTQLFQVEDILGRKSQGTQCTLDISAPLPPKAALPTAVTSFFECDSCTPEAKGKAEAKGSSDSGEACKAYAGSLQKDSTVKVSFARKDNVTDTGVIASTLAEFIVPADLSKGRFDFGVGVDTDLASFGAGFTFQELEWSRNPFIHGRVGARSAVTVPLKKLTIAASIEAGSGRDTMPFKGIIGAVLPVPSVDVTGYAIYQLKHDMPRDAKSGWGSLLSASLSKGKSSLAFGCRLALTPMSSLSLQWGCCVPLSLVMASSNPSTGAKASVCVSLGGNLKLSGTF